MNPVDKTVLHHRLRIPFTQTREHTATNIVVWFLILEKKLDVTRPPMFAKPVELANEVPRNGPLTVFSPPLTLLKNQPAAFVVLTISYDDAMTKRPVTPTQAWFYEWRGVDIEGRFLPSLFNVSKQEMNDIRVYVQKRLPEVELP
jgi:hypothetical protein